MAQQKAKIGKQIYYIGSDDGYFVTIKHRYTKNYPNENFAFETIEPAHKNQYQRIFAKLVQVHPSVIYIDFSTMRESQLRLAQLLTRENSLRKVPIVGLVEEKGHVRDCLSSGVAVTHVKCGEYHDVVFDPIIMAYPKEVLKSDFARAKLSKPEVLIDDFRIGFITKDAIHAEGSIELSPGETIKIDIDLPESLLPSKEFIVKAVDDKNLYYDFKYAYELQYLYVTKPEEKENDKEDFLGESDPAKLAKLQAEAQKRKKEQEANYQDLLSRTKKKIKDWVINKTDTSAPKKTKIMIVDKGMTVMTQEKMMDEYPYAIRFQTFLSDSFRELESFRPNIIAYQFIRDGLFGGPYDFLNEKAILPLFGEADSTELTVEEQELREKVINEEAEKSRTDLIRIIQYIKSIEGYNPFLIIFNCTKYTSTSFQESFKYPLVLTHKNSIDLRVITHMAEVLENKQKASYDEKIQNKIKALKKKDPVKYRALKAQDFEEVRVYVKKDNPLSHASYQYPVILESITESELSFSTEAELELTSFRLNHPVPMSITLIPEDGKKYITSGKLKTYRALIHSVNEVDKRELRKYVNSIFFDPLTQKRDQENKAYQDLNQKIQGEREKREEEQKHLVEKRVDSDSDEEE